jgi:hypothetical protein
LACRVHDTVQLSYSIHIEIINQFFSPPQIIFSVYDLLHVYVYICIGQMALMLLPRKASTMLRTARRGSRVERRSSFIQNEAPQPQ